MALAGLPFMVCQIGCESPTNTSRDTGVPIESAFVCSVIEFPAVLLEGKFEMESEVVATAYFVGFAQSTENAEVSLSIQVESATTTPSLTLSHVTARDSGNKFVVSSRMFSQLIYRPGATYVFDARLPADSRDYRGSIVAPILPSHDAFSLLPEDPPISANSPNIRSHRIGQELVVEWPRGTGLHSFVTVLRASDENPSSPEVVYDRPMHEGSANLQELSTSAETKLTIPGVVFAEPGSYAIRFMTLAAADTGVPISTVWDVLAGSGEVIFFVIN